MAVEIKHYTVMIMTNIWPLLTVTRLVGYVQLCQHGLLSLNDSQLKKQRSSKQ